MTTQPPQNQTKTGAQAAGKRVILYIEDEENRMDSVTIRQAMDRMMPDISFLQAAHLQDAEAMLQRYESIELILLDFGQQNAARRQDIFTKIESLSKNIPVVVLAGLSDHEMIVGLINSGADNYIKKSIVTVDPEVLRDAIDIAIYHHKQSKKRLSEKDQVIGWLSGGYSVQH